MCPIDQGVREGVENAPGLADAIGVRADTGQDISIQIRVVGDAFIKKERTAVLSFCYILNVCATLT